MSVPAIPSSAVATGRGSEASAFTKKIAAACACAMLWACPALSLAADDVSISIDELGNTVKPIFLSDKDDRYKPMQRVQAEYCRRVGSLACEPQTARCAMIVLERLVELQRKGTPLPELEANVQIGLDSCRLHGTHFEATGAHLPLSASLARVHAAARSMSVSLGSEPIIGALPLLEPNAGANQVVPIIYVNQRFFLFVSDFSKVVCLSVPVRYQPEGREVLAGEHASRLLIEQSPTIRDALLHYLAVYTGRNDGRFYDSNQLCDDVMLSYAISALDFVVAHEYAHLALRHPATLPAPPLHTQSIAQSDSRDGPGARSFLVRELEADAFAYRLLARAPETFSPKDKTGFHKNYLGGIEFYFQVREIFLEAAGFQTTAPGEARATATAALAERVAACIWDSACAVSGFEAELNKAFDPDQHPPARFRRDVARGFRLLAQRESPNSLGALIDLLTRNARLLWEGSHAEWDARAADKARFAAFSRGAAGDGEDNMSAIERLLRNRQDLVRLAEKQSGQLSYSAELNAVGGELGESRMAQGDLTAARAEFGAVLLGARKLVEASQASGASGDWAKVGKRQTMAAMRALARLDAAAGERDKASSNYSQAIDVAESLLAEEPRDRPLRDDLAEMVLQNANLRLRIGDPGRAEGALVRLGQLLDESPSSSEQTDQMRSVRSELLWDLADAQSKAGEVQRARAHYQLAVAVLERLAASASRHVGYQRLLAQRSTLLAIKDPALESWGAVVAKWDELDRRGGLKESERQTVEYARLRASNQKP